MVKKILIVLVSLYPCIAAAASVRIISPNGGESWTLGQTYSISWEPTNVSENIKLVLVKGSRNVGFIAWDLPSSPGNYLWKAGKYQGGMAAAGTDYKVRVTTISGSLRDESDAFFSLAESTVLRSMPPTATGTPTVVPAAITLLEPNNGETFACGDMMRVRWQSTGAIDRVTIRLDRQTPSALTKAVVTNTSNDGTEDFQIPSTFRYGGTFKVRVFGHTTPDAWVEDACDRDLVITPSFELAVSMKEGYIVIVKEGTDVEEVLEDLFVPGKIVEEIATLGKIKQKRLKATFRVRNLNNIWPTPTMTIPWRLRVERVADHVILGTIDGTVQMTADQPVVEQTVQFDLGKDAQGTHKFFFEADPDHVLPEPEFWRADNIYSRSFNLQ